MKISITAEVNDAFEKGCCDECPFSYAEDHYDEDVGNDTNFFCALGHENDDCPIEIVEGGIKYAAHRFRQSS